MPLPFRLLPLTLALIICIPAMADMRASATVSGLQFSLTDLRPDDHLAAAGFIGGWSGSVNTTRWKRSTPTDPDDTAYRSAQFDSMSPTPEAVRFQEQALDLGGGMQGVADLSAYAQGNPSAFGPRNDWIWQFGRGGSSGRLELHIGAYSAVTLTLHGSSEIIRTGVESGLFQLPSSLWVTNIATFPCGARKPH